MSGAITVPSDLPLLRAMTTDEAFEHALKVLGVARDSWLARRLTEAERPSDFFDRGYALIAADEIAVCAYFVSRAGIAVMTHGEDR